MIPGSGRSSGEGHGNPLQYSCLENPHGQRSHVQAMGSQRVRHDCMHTHTLHRSALETVLGTSLLPFLFPNRGPSTHCSEMITMCHQRAIPWCMKQRGKGALGVWPLECFKDVARESFRVKGTNIHSPNQVLPYFQPRHGLSTSILGEKTGPISSKAYGHTI